MLPSRAAIDTLVHRIQLHAVSSDHPCINCGADKQPDFVHTGRSIGDWYEFMDEMGLFWARIDYTEVGFASVDLENFVPTEVWELEEAWSVMIDPENIPGLLPRDED